ncbi:MAG: tRNA pseudouridine synthase A, partial [Bacteroidota bacterium]|nr:tRNA pseudouridine synthase A [Bacteroidota bacterium]
ALSLILREEIRLTGAGRTDTGVHASFFVAHFDSSAVELYGTAQLVFKLNRFLKQDLLIHSVYQVPDQAHARFDAISRTYQYFVSRNKQPYFNGLVALHSGPLDLERMNLAADILKEYDDFKCFSRSHSGAKTTICHIDYARWEEKMGINVFTIRADRFLRNMVRAVVGTLFEIGGGKLSLDEFKEVIESRDRSEAGNSVPAHGLFLTDIRYPKELESGLIRREVGFNLFG